MPQSRPSAVRFQLRRVQTTSPPERPRSNCSRRRLERLRRHGNGGRKSEDSWGERLWDPGPVQHGKLQPHRSVGSAGCFVAGLPSYCKLHREERPPTWRWNDRVPATPSLAGKTVGGGATAVNYHVDKSHSAVPSSRGVLNDDAVGGQDWAIGKVQQSDERRYD